MASPSQEQSGRTEALAALQRFTRPRAAAERCELCGAELAEEHPHLLQRETRQIACACQACALLFCDQKSGRYLRVPRRVRLLEDFVIEDLEWEQMALPINLAFFVRNREGQTTALYPSPAGAVESLISSVEWEYRIAAHPVARTMEPETEALLVNRLAAQHLSFLVPIDECYRLVGLIRRSWHGLSGGPEVWMVVARFFGELQQRAAGAQVRRA